MKIGCCANMIASKPDKTGVEWVEKLATIGYDYVELPLAEMTALSDEDFSDLVKKVEASGIKCETCNNFFPPTFRLTGKNIHTEKTMAYVEMALTRAEKLGVEHVVFGSGGAKNVPDGFPMQEGYWQVVSLLKGIAPIARNHGIVVTIEPLRQQECNLINTFEQGCKLAEDVNCADVRVLVDFYHLSQENEPVANIENLGAKYLRHAHFARNDGRAYPAHLGEDENYAHFFAALKSGGYNRRISLEAYTQDFDKEAPVALRLLRDMCL